MQAAFYNKIEGCCVFYKMKPRYIKRPIADEQTVIDLQQKGLSRTVAELLVAHGIDSGNYDDFVDDKAVFHSPFEMANMEAATETIRFVMESGGKILIYGDYDADGLTAAGILSLFFSDNGIENDVVIPTRDEGYGLHAANVLRAFENDFYDLVLTVDCGISNAEDINKIVSELGVEVIVTDHHELPEVLPDCICVNPKLGYPFPYLAGAGVAWKLVEALAGREAAAKYSDLACIGTIGDIMPLRDENRALVKMGLSNMRHKSLRRLAELSNCSAEISANDVAMRITPKINAAGRVGAPQAALDVLLSRDRVDQIKINRLLELNEKRKQLLEEITAQSDEMCDVKKIMRERMVFLYSDNWQHGLLGIVASRYKEKYKLPAIIMTSDGDNYVGSARGIDTINLFEVFSQCKDCLVKFGGHKASVGFSVSKNKLDELRRKLVSLLNSYDKTLFERRTYYDVVLGEDCTAQDILSLTDKLQPLLPQDKILCRVRDHVLYANSFGKDDAHLSATLACGLEIKGFFKYGAYAPFIKNGANVDVICTLETDSYTHNVCGIIEDISLENSVCFDDFYRINLLKNFAPEHDNPRIDEKTLAELVGGDNVALVFDDYETYLEYGDKISIEDFCVDVFFDSGLSKVVAVSPLDDYCFDRFDKVVCFSNSGFVRNIANALYFEARPARKELYEMDLTREVCAGVYSALRKKGKFDSLKAVYDKYLTAKLSYAQFVVALRVFEELKLITISDEYNVQLESSSKRDLADSAIFEIFQKR